MKFLIRLLLLLSLLTSCATRVDLSTAGKEAPLLEGSSPEEMGMELVWSDEFDGDTVSDQWVLADNPRRGGFWSPDAVEVKDGAMQIKTYYHEETDRYIDGCASTVRKDFLYGYYAARIRMKKDIGHWGAFWIWNHPYEIDIMEKPFTGDQIHQALHWYSPIIKRDHAEKSIDVKAEGLDEGWHVYSVLWEPDRYVFYVDGVKTWELDSTDVDIADVAGEIIFSDEINSGEWIGVGNIKNNRELPDLMEVDWIRVYEQP